MALLAGCATAEDGQRDDPEPPDRLLVTRDDGRGTALRLELDCERGDRERCGSIAERLPELRPDPGEACAEVFAGPESILVSGRLDGTPVSLSLERSDSCGDARYRILDTLLSPSPG